VLYAAADDTWQSRLNNGTGMLILHSPPVVFNRWTHLSTRVQAHFNAGTTGG
jgi:hypothetical protein